MRDNLVYLFQALKRRSDARWCYYLNLIFPFAVRESPDKNTGGAPRGTFHFCLCFGSKAITVYARFSLITAAAAAGKTAKKA
jgi:hypothetical protein